MPEVAHLLMHEGIRILQRTGNTKELEILFKMADLKEMLPLYLECCEANDFERFIKEANGSDIRCFVVNDGVRYQLGIFGCMDCNYCWL